MDIDDLKRVNKLWSKIYPYLASQIIQEYRRETGEVLELGPFSGGISLELARRYPLLNITIADETPGVIDYLGEEIASAGSSPGIQVRQTGFDRLDFDDGHFDLIVCRGAFFFLDEALLGDIFRVLKAGGLAFIGGGYGKATPPEVIGEIAEESRDLNRRLGRKWVSKDGLVEMVRKTGLTASCRLVEEGGLWLRLTK